MTTLFVPTTSSVQGEAACNKKMCYYYILTFEAGAEIVTFRTVKNVRTGADIASVINNNFPNFQKDFVVYDDENNGKIVRDKDSVRDGCVYSVVRRRTSRSQRPAASTVKVL